KAPVQTQNAGRTTVAIEQSKDKAILSWETFNVGRNTTVDFKQQADWAVLNRVNDPQMRPSQIQGQIKGDGTVMIANANGVVFSGTSQVNVRNLVAAAANISDAQFNIGLFGANETTATFKVAAGQVLVEQGAQIATATSANSTTGGGYVLLAGKQVHNAGTITTPNGQTALAAGDSFVIKRGQGTEGNQQSTTRGNEITAQFTVGSTAGAVSNTGLITAATGDITLIGNRIEQAGVALASTSVNNRGTLHLHAGGENAEVILAEGAATAILLDESATALDSQRDSLLAPTLDRAGNIVSGDKYRRDQSLVEIKSAGTVDFKNGSITLATGGQVAVDAAERALLRDGSIIDVSGALG
ncbi:MAG: two-partner secretion domain-containing protein, partial [Rhodanobacter sp.]